MPRCCAVTQDLTENSPARRRMCSSTGHSLIASGRVPKTKSTFVGGTTPNDNRWQSANRHNGYMSSVPKKAMVTGSGGLIGSECARLLAREGWNVVGVDNDMRQQFFGPAGTTRAVVRDLVDSVPGYRHFDLDIRDRQGVRDLFSGERPDFVIHTAAQPSHDRAASIPYDDFDVNAVGTMNMLVAARDFCKDSPFCFTSTNKVYGDRQLHPHDLRRIQSGGRRDVPGIWPLLPDARRHLSRGLSHRTAALRCRTARLPGVHHYLRDDREGIPDLRLPGKAGPRPDSLARRGQPVHGVLPGAALRGGVQPGWRAPQQYFHSGNHRPAGRHGLLAEAQLQGREPRRRPHLLHLGSEQDSPPFSQLEDGIRSAQDRRRDRSGAPPQSEPRPLGSGCPAYPNTTSRNSALWPSIHAAISPMVRRASRRGCQPRTAVTARWSVMYQRRSAGRSSFVPTTSTVRPVTSRHRVVASRRERLLVTPPPTFQWRPA